jgi:acetyl-CoA acetyltransferase
MYEYGATPEQMAKIAMYQRVNTLANPDAPFNDKPLTIAELLAFPLIVDPLHLFEIVKPYAALPELEIAFLISAA